MADLDDFKAVNDAHGHAVGDHVLREFARVLRETVREIDLAGRWGGEEFLVLLPGADATGGAQLADRVRAASRSAHSQGRDGDEGEGDRQLRRRLVPARSRRRELFSAADGALYRAKRTGKNRVRAEAPVRSF